MRWVPISETKEGMFLGEPVMDSEGRMVAAKGEALSGSVIAHLRNAGVKSIFVEEVSAGAEPSGSADAARRQAIAEVTHAARKRLDIRFRRFKDAPLMQTIRNLAEKHLIKAGLAKRPNRS